MQYLEVLEILILETGWIICPDRNATNTDGSGALLHSAYLATIHEIDVWYTREVSTQPDRSCYRCVLQTCETRTSQNYLLSVVLGIRIPACSLVPGTSPLGKGREAYAHILHFAHLHV